MNMNAETNIYEIEFNKRIYVLKDLKQPEIKTFSLPVVEGTPYKIGANYLIRTITMIYTGKLKAVYNKELVLTECAWIPETQRWADSVKNGNFKEVEPYPTEMEVNINRDAILDSAIVTFDLPKKQQ